MVMDYTLIQKWKFPIYFFHDHPTQRMSNEYYWPLLFVVVFSFQVKFIK